MIKPRIEEIVTAKHLIKEHVDAQFCSARLHSEMHRLFDQIEALQVKCDDYEKVLKEIRKAIDPFPQRIAHEVLAKHMVGG